MNKEAWNLESEFLRQSSMRLRLASMRLVGLQALCADEADRLLNRALELEKLREAAPSSCMFSPQGEKKG